MLSQLVTGTAMIIATVLFQVAGLVALSVVLTRAGTRFAGSPSPLRTVGLLAPSVLFVLLLHVSEAWGWAALLISVGEFAELEEALYFSTVTATTLGYGDVTLSGEWRLLGAFEAMGGLILFAASTAFLIALVREALGDSALQGAHHPT